EFNISGDWDGSGSAPQAVSIASSNGVRSSRSTKKRLRIRPTFPARQRLAAGESVSSLQDLRCRMLSGSPAFVVALGWFLHGVDGLTLGRSQLSCFCAPPRA